MTERVNRANLQCILYCEMSALMKKDMFNSTCHRAESE